MDMGGWRQLQALNSSDHILVRSVPSALNPDCPVVSLLHGRCFGFQAYWSGLQMRRPFGSQGCNLITCFYYLNMQKQFETVLKRRPTRERFYSSMNYDEYCEVYGPPSPIVKPQEDPIQDIPLFDLEGSVTAEPPALNDTVPDALVSRLKMDTILEIDGSENFTLNMGASPRVDLFLKNSKSREFTLGEAEVPKRMRVRMRSQSDNSEYLIFNFLERVNEKGRKRVKLD